VRKRKYS